MSWDLPANSNSSQDETMARSQGTVIIRQFLQHYIGLKIQTWCSDCPRWWYWAVRTVYWLRYICMISDAGVGSMLVESVGGCGWWLSGPHQDPAVPVRSGMLRSEQWAEWTQAVRQSHHHRHQPPRQHQYHLQQINVSRGMPGCDSVTVWWCNPAIPDVEHREHWAPGWPWQMLVRVGCWVSRVATTSSLLTSWAAHVELNTRINQPLPHTITDTRTIISDLPGDGV